MPHNIVEIISKKDYIFIIFSIVILLSFVGIMLYVSNTNNDSPMKYDMGRNPNRVRHYDFGKLNKDK